MLAYVLDLSSKPGPTPLQQLADLQVTIRVDFNLECCFSVVICLGYATIMIALPWAAD